MSSKMFPSPGFGPVSGTAGDPARRSARPRPPQLPGRGLGLAALLNEGDPDSTEGVAVAGVVSPEQRLVQRATMGMTRKDMKRITSLGYDAWLEEQLDYQSLDDSQLEATLLAAFPTLGMEPWEVWNAHTSNWGQAAYEAQDAAIFRAIYSPRQLFERMVVFWTDHFNIDIFNGWGEWLKPVDDRDVIRTHAMGTFPELLRASARSPAMLAYLNNDTNNKYHPNENYARELMELHTLRADNGYTQQDVREVARCFTGWTFYYPDDGHGALAGLFRFDPSVHDFDAKTVLGQTIPAGGGVEDAETVLDILAQHPNTARFIAEKLLRYFWRYQPTVNSINRVAAEYTATGGDIRAMLRVILRRNRMERAYDKLKRPFHLMVSGMRALKGDLSHAYGLWAQLELAGQVPFTWRPPNGFPDAEGYWSGHLLPRWNYGFELATGDLDGAELNLSSFNPSTSIQKLIKRIDKKLTNRTLTEASRLALETYLTAGPLTQQRIDETVALGLTTAEFQRY